MVLLSLVFHQQQIAEPAVVVHDPNKILWPRLCRDTNDEHDGSSRNCFVSDRYPILAGAVTVTVPEKNCENNVIVELRRNIGLGIFVGVCVVLFGGIVPPHVQTHYFYIYDYDYLYEINKMNSLYY